MASWRCSECRETRDNLVPHTCYSDHHQIKQAALALVEKIEKIHADSGYQSIWTLAANRGMSYKGPNYSGELQTLKQALGLYDSAAQRRTET